jgi:tetratricopeptide (TPR) repeat protein
VFRHLGDERQLLGNPLVGPDIQAGRLTFAEFRARIGRAAATIRDDDAASGRAERGKRQSACLLRCDLGSESLAVLAAEFQISPRQLARERREAWLRALSLAMPATASLAPASMADIVQNRALALFRAGREREATHMVREHIAASGSEAASFALCGLALMQFEFKRTREAQETFEELDARATPEARAASACLDLAMCFLEILLGKDAAGSLSSTHVRDSVRRAALETSTSPWISRTILRLFFALFRKFVSAHDYKNMGALSSEIDEMNAWCTDLDDRDSLALHTMKSISEWKQNGFNADMEAHTLAVLHVAIANGITDVVAEGASLLSRIYYLTGDVAAARDYRDLALGAASLTDDTGSIALVYNNLALAALDGGCVGAAAHFTGQYFPAKGAAHPLLEHIPLVAAEILIKQGSVKQGMVQAREVLQLARAAGNQRVVATAGRIVAMAHEARGNRRDAIALLKDSLEIARAGYCSNYDTARIEESHDELSGIRDSTTALANLTYQDFF